MMAAQVAALRKLHIRTIVVSSGAVHLGCKKLGLNKRPTSVEVLQAAAAAGQSSLMLSYEAALGRFELVVGQVLLTHADLSDRKRYSNARATLETLLNLGAVPIVNENDTVSVKELTFGDNDQLASALASVIGADALVLLTDVEGVMNQEGERLPVIHHESEAQTHVRSQTDLEKATSLGGMKSKIRAASLAAQRGIRTWIADAREPDALERIAKGDTIGTYFAPPKRALSARKHWIGHMLRPHGTLFVDEGAAQALVRHGGSLLPAGVTAVAGEFEAGDVVEIKCTAGVVGQGLCRYNIRDVAKLAGSKTREIEARLGYAGPAEVIHRDDLVIFMTQI